MDNQNNIDKLIGVYDIYSEITNRRLFVKILTVKKWYMRVSLLLTSCVCIMLFIMMEFAKSPIIKSLWLFSFIAAFVLLCLLFSMAQKIVFKDYYKKFSKRIKFSSYNKNYIRYLIFKDELDKRKFSHGYMVRVLKALKIEEQQNNKISIFSQPWIYILVIAIIAFAVSFFANFTLDVRSIILAVLFVLLYFGIGSVKIPISRANKLAELKQFILRYLSDLY